MTIEAVAWNCPLKEMLSKILQILQGHNCAFFIKVDINFFTSEILVFLIRIPWNANSDQKLIICQWKTKKKLTPVYVRKKNLLSSQFMCTCIKKQNCFHKTWHTLKEISFNGNRKKEVCFSFSEYEKWNLYFGIMIVWVLEKLHFEKWKLYHVSQITIC